MPDAERILICAAILLAYAALCIFIARKHRRRLDAAASPAWDLLASEHREGAPPWLVAFASQTGFAEQLALRTAEMFRSSGAPVHVMPLGALDEQTLLSTRRALFIVSTTGEGDAPDSAARFVSRLMPASIDLSRLQYGLLALGDRSYSRFCGFGHQLQGWLQHRRANPFFDVVTVNNGDEGTLRHWQHHLGQLSGQTRLPDWIEPRYESWQLLSRDLLNPGSVGGPVYRIRLLAPRAIRWSPGDIVEILPQDPLSTSAEHLPHREYSIASLPTEGALEIVVRQMRHPDGRLGIGSGWLTEHAPLGNAIGARVRENRTFHPPEDGRPMILIGNGTGIAGLRAHLKARALRGARRNWLLFGERHAARDYFFRGEIEAWRAGGVLERLDLAFSRDQPERLYVQHVLNLAAAELVEWVNAGAALYVCGSLEGMSTGVATVLKNVLGVEILEDLAADGRYRRDVY